MMNVVMKLFGVYDIFWYCLLFDVLCHRFCVEVQVGENICIRVSRECFLVHI